MITWRWRHYGYAGENVYEYSIERFPDGVVVRRGLDVYEAAARPDCHTYVILGVFATAEEAKTLVETMAPLYLMGRDSGVPEE